MRGRGDDGRLWLTRAGRGEPQPVGQLGGGVRALGVACEGKLLLVGTTAGSVDVWSGVDWTRCVRSRGIKGP